MRYVPRSVNHPRSATQQIGSPPSPRPVGASARTGKLPEIGAAVALMEHDGRKPGGYPADAKKTRAAEQC